MLTKNLECILKVALKGLIQDRHDIFNEAIGIQKNNAKFRYLFLHPEQYFARHEDAKEDDPQCDVICFTRVNVM